MKTTYTLALLAVLSVTGARAQEPEPLPTPAVPQPLPTPAGPPGRPPRGGTSMQVQAVVSRSHAGKTTSRLPYTVMCVADGAGRSTTLRMGVEVPVAVGGGKGIQYRNVGTNIDCTCEHVDGDRYRLKMALEQSSISDLGPTAPKPRPAAKEADDEAGEGGNPMFRTFTSTFTAILRDGQTALSTAATDPVTSDDVTIEVTLKVMK